MPERIDWTEEARRNYSRPSFGRWYHHNRRQARRWLRNTAGKVVKIALIAVVAAYVLAGGMRLTNGYTFGEAARFSVMDTRLAITCWHSPGVVLDFVSMRPFEGRLVLDGLAQINYEAACP